MIEIQFVVPSTPRGKGASKHTRTGFTYTDHKTRDYLKSISKIAMETMRDMGLEPTDLPCKMIWEANFEVPASYSKKKTREALDGTLRYTKKPDTDNITKCKDALTGIVFLDDKQVWKECMTKRYALTASLKVTIQIETRLDTVLDAPVEVQANSA